jgi:hypothetical protein
MNLRSPFRRRILAGGSALLLARRSSAETARSSKMVTVYTFGDSILDCARYNEYGVHPGQLIVQNNDALFPDFKGRDLQSRGPARLEHRAVDGATLSGLPSQARGLVPSGECVALLTVGGNDLLTGLAGDSGSGVKAFEAALDHFVRSLPVRPVILGTVYDPTFGDDTRNFLGVPARTARPNLRRVNDAIRSVAAKYGRVADIHAHFLKGDTSWYTRTIEPSLTGASEVRRVFLDAL